MGVKLLHHVQLAMPAGGASRARECRVGPLSILQVPKPGEWARRCGCWFGHAAARVHPVSDPFGYRVELLAPAATPA
jgi:hypothetical protein